ncbi:MAG TPA: M1 family aminopeptidase [Polyangiaceae bacterium]|nr:M1 family aminopeptidase [Polyangiaceae bacterium]
MRVSCCAGLLALATMLSAACGDDSSPPVGAEGGRASGGAASGGIASGGDAGAKASGGSGPAAAGAGGGPTEAGSGPGGTGNGGAGGSDAGAGGSDPIVIYPERDIELTELDIDLATQTGTAAITLAPSTTLGARFNAKGLTIRSISLDGEPVPYELGPTGLAVRVPASAESTTIVVEYDWQFNTESHGISPDGFTLIWPYYCGNVFPCNTNPSDGTRFKLSVSGATQTLVYPQEISNEAPSYMLGWVQGDYTRVELGATVAGTHVSMWHLPDGEADAALGGAHLVEAFDWLEQHLGPYLFGGDVGVVAVDWGPKSLGGMEHHPYWHIAAKSISDEVVNVHEASHGWFGNGIRLRCWEDLVLSEGTATYLAARVLEEVTGSDATWARYEADFASRLPAGNRRAWYPAQCNLIDVVTSGLFNRVTYLKGAFFLRALEQEVGRSAFDEALRTFYLRFAGEAARVQDLLDVVSEVTDYDPQDCAEAWLASSLTIPEFGPCS